MESNRVEIKIFILLILTARIGALSNYGFKNFGRFDFEATLDKCHAFSHTISKINCQNDLNQSIFTSTLKVLQSWVTFIDINFTGYNRHRKKKSGRKFNHDDGTSRRRRDARALLTRLARGISRPPLLSVSPWRHRRKKRLCSALRGGDSSSVCFTTWGDFLVCESGTPPAAENGEQCFFCSCQWVFRVPLSLESIRWGKVIGKKNNYEKEYRSVQTTAFQRRSKTWIYFINGISALVSKFS